MRPICENDAIQIEITNFCQFKCSQCTRFCGHHVKPFFITVENFKKAIDSLVGFVINTNGIVGFMGGSPEWHRDFEELCEYALSKIPRERLGLWGTFPPQKRHLRDVICRTFGNLLLNDHSRNDILHAPILQASEDFFRMPCPDCSSKCVEHGGGRCDCSTCNGTGYVTDEVNLFAATERCWVAESWSSSINPKGAWFCEVAGALSDLFDGPDGWPVEADWWKRTSKDYTSQREWACRRCGCALPLVRPRSSQDPTDDVSASNLERLKEIKSRKVARGEFNLVERFQFDPELVKSGCYPKQTYKDEEYRRGIALRYGIGLTMNNRGYWEPFLLPDGWQPEKKPNSLFNILQNKYTQEVGA